jgi:hypothetical protein
VERQGQVRLQACRERDQPLGRIGDRRLAARPRHRVDLLDHAPEGPGRGAAADIAERQRGRGGGAGQGAQEREFVPHGELDVTGHLRVDGGAGADLGQREGALARGPVQLAEDDAAGTGGVADAARRRWSRRSARDRRRPGSQPTARAMRSGLSMPFCSATTAIPGLVSAGGAVPPPPRCPRTSRRTARCRRDRSRRPGRPRAPRRGHPRRRCAGQPRSRMAARWRPRSTTCTSTPARPAGRQPAADPPAPTTAILMTLTRSLEPGRRGRGPGPARGPRSRPRTPPAGTARCAR